MYGIFHPCDSNYLYILESMYEKKVSEANQFQDENSRRSWVEALKVGNEILVAYSKLYPRYDINTALMALKLGKIASYLENNSKSRGKIIYYNEYSLCTMNKKHTCILVYTHNIMFIPFRIFRKSQI